MSIVRWDPFTDLAQLRDQMNRLFDSSMTRSGHEPASMRTWAPAVDIAETEDALIVRAELAGITPEEVDIQVTGDTLTVKGERKYDKADKSQHMIRVERAYGAFQRSFTLGIPIKAQEVKATYHDGVLEITIPKAEEVKPKQIKVEVTGKEKEITVA